MSQSSSRSYFALISLAWTPCRGKRSLNSDLSNWIIIVLLSVCLLDLDVHQLLTLNFSWLPMVIWIFVASYSLMSQLLPLSNLSIDLLFLLSWRTNAMQPLPAWDGHWLQIVELILRWFPTQPQLMLPLPFRPRRLRHLWNLRLLQVVQKQKHLQRHTQSRPIWLFLSRHMIIHMLVYNGPHAILKEWSIRFTSRSSRTPTTNASYLLKKSLLLASPIVEILNTSSMACQEIGSGPYKHRTIGVTFLKFPFYMGTILFATWPLLHLCLLKQQALWLLFRIWLVDFPTHWRLPGHRVNWTISCTWSRTWASMTRSEPFKKFHGQHPNMLSAVWSCHCIEGIQQFVHSVSNTSSWKKNPALAGCVCVTHLYRCKTSTLTCFFAGGARDHCKSGTNKDTCLDLWYQKGTPFWRTCQSEFLFLQWPGAKPRTPPPIFHVYTVTAIWTIVLESTTYDRRFIADILVGTTSPIHRRRQQFGFSMCSFYSILFDVDSDHADHSGELPSFVGCVVDSFVSCLICMFQDSVPAGSYNDPF